MTLLWKIFFKSLASSRPLSPTTTLAPPTTVVCSPNHAIGSPKLTGFELDGDTLGELSDQYLLCNEKFDDLHDYLGFEIMEQDLNLMTYSNKSAKRRRTDDSVDIASSGPP